MSEMRELMDRVGVIADMADNCWAMARNRMLPEHIHVEGLLGAMKEIRDSLREIVKDGTGENPWED